MIRILGTVLAGLLGLAFGSFLNVCLSRWPMSESVVKPRSHCRQCGRTLAWWENVPLVSWLALRGRCRTCHAWIGWRYPLVELAVGVLWATFAWHALEQLRVLDVADQFGIVPSQIGLIPLIGTMFFLWLLVGIAVLDAEHFWVADAATLPGIALGFAFSVWSVSLLQEPLRDQSGFWIRLGQRFLEVLAAASLILLIRWVYWLVRRREGVGLGDAKLMALLAAWLGLPGALLAFVMGVVLGTLVGAVLLVIPSAKSDTSNWKARKLPLGTFLCIGGIISSLWGQPIIAAYLRWGGF
ncbi:MAG: prepilin peptidase [Terracidiphilus sp.]|jgi:leader peptidase (prepilin peptidase)/N-methyltransferase